MKNKIFIWIVIIFICIIVIRQIFYRSAMNTIVSIEIALSEWTITNFEATMQKLLMNIYWISSAIHEWTYTRLIQWGFLENSWWIAKIGSGFSFGDVSFGIGYWEYMNFSNIGGYWYEWYDS